MIRAQRESYRRINHIKILNTPPFKSSLGLQGEEKAVHYLQAEGFTIVQRNFAKRGGEIDIIACKGDLLIFVEVKTRSNAYFSTSEVVTPSKQKKIIYTAKSFLAQSEYVDKACRFDVILVEGGSLQVTHIPHAFCESS